ncbi:hypothetical protein [Burkholderia sp. IDO3]|uniref:hypothetical protein n=1 Tax=Burkholderia sp. IDO3 TaxID=1705310 RepID=UPI0011774727|nr:hypothetical protein [Burkholderia sp. IDO3]
MIDATRGFTKQLHNTLKRLCGGPPRHLTVKTLALHFDGCHATVRCRQTPSGENHLTNAQPRLTPRFTPAGRIADVHDTHISEREIMKTFQPAREIGRERPGERGPKEDAGAARRRHST